MNWQIDAAHTSVEAQARHMMFTTVRVRFPGTSGEVFFDPDRPETARVRLEIPVNELESGDARRDTHLRSGDFFDGDRHPTLVFRSTSVRRTAPRRFALAGDLTIRGTTRPVTVDMHLQALADDPMAKGRKRAFFEARTRIDRREWGLVWNMPVPQGVLVSNEIGIEISAQVTSAALAERAA